MKEILGGTSLPGQSVTLRFRRDRRPLVERLVNTVDDPTLRMLSVSVVPTTLFNSKEDRFRLLFRAKSSGGFK